MKNNIIILLGILFALSISSCEKLGSDLDPNINNANGTRNFKVNSWIKEVVDSTYYWNDKIPPNSDVNFESSINSFFNSIIYSELDKWSTISDDFSNLNSSNSTSGSGIKLWFNNENGVVIYVDSESPAKKAGIERGDIIKQVNKEAITSVNQYNILLQDSLELVIKKSNSSSTNDTTITFDTEIYKENPVLADSTYSISGTNIGYIALSPIQKTTTAKAEISKVLDNFTADSITNIIIDFRYSTGGDILLAEWVTSALLPKTHFTNNDTIGNIYKTSSNSSTILFTETNYDFNFNKIAFITSNTTSGTGELIISAIKPYKTFNIFGENTNGNFYISEILYDQTNLYSYNYGIKLIVGEFINSNGDSNSKNGIAPNQLITEDFGSNIYELGSTKDTLTAAAINYILN